MATVKFKVDLKDSAYVTANPSKVLETNEIIWLDDGRFAFGDDATALSGLTWFGANTVSTGLLSGGTITVGTFGGSGSNNDIRVAAATWYITGSGTFSTSLNTDFNDVSLSSSGTQRYVGLFGKNDGTIIKSEGSEAALASLPATPANHAVIGYVLVTDAALSTTPDLSGYLLKADKATPSDVSTGTDNDTYMTPYSHANAGITTTVTSAATITPSVGANPNITDFVTVTALATNPTIAAPSGTATNGKRLIIRIKDNGTSRTLTFNSIYRFSTDLAAPSATTVNKTLYLGFIYNSADTKWDCLAKLDNLG